MNVLLKTNLFTGLALIFIASGALAGGAVGNGGNGVVINNTPYVLDLVEAGVEKKSIF